MLGDNPSLPLQEGSRCWSSRRTGNADADSGARATRTVPDEGSLGTEGWPPACLPARQPRLPTTAAPPGRYALPRRCTPSRSLATLLPLCVLGRAGLGQARRSAAGPGRWPGIARSLQRYPDPGVVAGAILGAGRDASQSTRCTACLPPRHAAPRFPSEQVAGKGRQSASRVARSRRTLFPKRARSTRTRHARGVARTPPIPILRDSFSPTVTGQLLFRRHGPG